MNSQKLTALMKLFNEEAPIARAFGMKLSFTEDKRAIIDLPYNPNLDRARGGIHGGVYATLLDNAGWFTAAVFRDDPRFLVTSELTIHFLEAAKGVGIRAVGKLIKHGKRQDVVEAHLFDENGKLIGHAVGTFVVPSNASSNGKKDSVF